MYVNETTNMSLCRLHGRPYVGSAYPCKIEMPLRPIYNKSIEREMFGAVKFVALTGNLF